MLILLFHKKSSSEVISLDEEGNLLRWAYQFKDGFLTYGCGYCRLDKSIDHIQWNNSNERIVVWWSNLNFIVCYFTIEKKTLKWLQFYLPTEDFVNNPIPNKDTILIESKIKIHIIKDFAFLKQDNWGLILHDNNQISIINFNSKWLIDTIKLNDADKDIDRIFAKDLDPHLISQNNPYLYTLILTALDNTIVYIAGISNLFEDWRIDFNHSFSFNNDKLPKIIKFNEDKNILFLINSSSPFKMYWILLDICEIIGFDSNLTKNVWYFMIIICLM